ncbi:MAG: restriction endonuclease subunit R, partial [Nitrospirae bacterium]|nr:restriction endonuclease subunit R [Nitrospirota bacterium]
DSKTEKDFAIILENDKSVLKWLRPSQRQFHIYWKHNSRQYHPDFVVETVDSIHMVETKKEGSIEDSDVQAKSLAAVQYCKHATEFTTQNSGKPWKYVLIPHNAVQANMSFDTLVRKHEVRG